MSESTNGNQHPGGNGTPPADARLFGLLQLYVKDMSFESPNTPGVLDESGLEPEIKMNLRTSHRKLDNGVVEVVLSVTEISPDSIRSL